MKILMVYDSLSPIGGGSQTAMLSWVGNLKKMGVKVKILCNKNAPSFIKEITKEDIIGLNNLNVHYFFPHYYPTLRLSQKIQQEILAFGPDIIHVHEPAFLVGQVLSFVKKKNILTLVTFQTDFAKQTLSQFPLSFFMGEKGIFKNWITKKQYEVFKKADFMTVPTNIYKSLVEKTFSNTPFLLSLPIKEYFYTKSRAKIKTVPHNLLAVSRLSGGKRIDILLQTMRLLRSRFHLTLIGDGPDKKYIQYRIKRCHLEDTMDLLGWVEQKKLPDYFKNADLFISPSDSETFGITYIDALASRVPVVCYDYPVSREVIPEGMAVFITSLEPRVWAEHLLQLQNNPQAYELLQKNIAKNYNKLMVYEETESTKRLVDVYKKILSSSK